MTQQCLQKVQSSRYLGISTEDTYDTQEMWARQLTTLQGSAGHKDSNDCRGRGRLGASPLRGKDRIDQYCPPYLRRLLPVSDRKNSRNEVGIPK